VQRTPEASDAFSGSHAEGADNAVSVNLQDPAAQQQCERYEHRTGTSAASAGSAFCLRFMSATRW
jgi:hypothetical protein